MKRPILLLVILALVLAVPIVEAHANAQSSDPPFGARLTASPHHVSIVFTQAIEPATTVFTLIDSDRNEYPLGPIEVSDDRLRATAEVLGPLPPAGYILQWRVVSAIDGHETRGAIPFGVGSDAAIADVGSMTQAPRVDAVVGKTLAFIGISLAAGAFAFWYLVLPASLRPGQAGPIGRIAFTGAALQFFGLALFANSQITIGGLGATAYLFDTVFGRGLLRRMGLALVLLFGLTLVLRRPEPPRVLFGVLAAVTLITFFAYGRFSHAATYVTPDWVGASVDGLHLVAIGIWTGGLVVLLSFLRSIPRDDEAALSEALRVVPKRFSDLATGSVILAGITGIFLVWAIVGFEVSTWIWTDHGALLAWKIVLAVVMILLGGVNKWVYVRWYVNGKGLETVDRFRGNVRREVALGVVVFLLAGAVTNLGPQDDGPAASEDDIFVPYVEDMLTYQMTSQNYDWSITFHPPIALFNSTHYIVELIDRETQVRETGPQYLRMTIVYVDDPDLGSTDVRLNRTAYGNYDVSGAFFNLAGEWRVTIEIPQGRIWGEHVRLDFEL